MNFIQKINEIKNEQSALKKALVSLLRGDDLDIKTIYKRNQSLFYRSLELIQFTEKINKTTTEEREYISVVAQFISSAIVAIKFHSRLTYDLWQAKICPTNNFFCVDSTGRNLSLYFAAIDAAEHDVKRLKAY